MTHVDVIVVGGGHAGVEAAAAVARRGLSVAMITARRDDPGTMSCNPSIGGIGKGHLVREIDVFDGVMGRAADAAAIHYRMLNRAKGSAVHGPRIQADRARYRSAVASILAGYQGLTIILGHVDRLSISNGRVDGVGLRDGSLLSSTAVILATGTFLGGRLFIGAEQTAGGRIAGPAAERLAAQLRELPVTFGRLKTGTPPRLDGRTIDWVSLDRQPSDREPWTMSPLTPTRSLPQLACAVTRTNRRSHDIVRAALEQSPLHTGDITGRGPRYCPSIEDKVIRFGDRDGHQLFLEPEGLDTADIYPNGISTSLPLAVQTTLIRSIAGLEEARITQPGYAVEYDYLDPRHLDARLAVRSVDGLFCAGQINGTTGYEEAAAQGLVAGLNAAAWVKGEEPVSFTRDGSYIGVLVDDLTLQGVTEPYRMLTARAEHRLRLRADNAATRLGGLAASVDAIGPARRAWLACHKRDHDHATDIVRRGDDEAAAALGAAGTEAIEDARYAPYVERQQSELARLQRGGEERLDSLDDYRMIPGLSTEMIEKLNTARPSTIGDAGRIRGITPAALTVILLALRRKAA